MRIQGVATSLAVVSAIVVALLVLINRPKIRQ
jgi:hypothetical protein